MVRLSQLNPARIITMAFFAGKHRERKEGGRWEKEGPGREGREGREGGQPIRCAGKNANPPILLYVCPITRNQQNHLDFRAPTLDRRNKLQTSCLPTTTTGKSDDCRIMRCSTGNGHVHALDCTISLEGDKDATLSGSSRGPR